jgi:hypothetical protein
MNTTDFRDRAASSFEGAPDLRLDVDRLVRQGRRRVRRRVAWAAVPVVVGLGILATGLSTLDVPDREGEATLATAPTSEAGPGDSSTEAEWTATLAGLLDEAVRDLRVVQRESPFTEDGAAMATAVVETPTGTGTVAVRLVTDAVELAGGGPCASGACELLEAEEDRRVLLSMVSSPAGTGGTVTSVFVDRGARGYVQASASDEVRDQHGRRVKGGAVPLSVEELQALAERADQALLTGG